MRSLIAALTIFLLSAEWSTEAAEPIRIGLSLGLTGRYAELAKMQERAYALWQTEVNARGGLLGRPVEITITDDRSDRDRARGIYRNFVEKNQVDIVFGPYSSAITAAVAGIVDKSDCPMIAPGAAADRIFEQSRNTVSILTPASRYSVGMLEVARKNGLKTVAIVYADDEFSEGVASGAHKYSPVRGLKVVMSAKFKKGTADLTDIARKVQESAASLLIVAGHYEESVAMRRALKQIRWYPRAYFATIGPALNKYHEVLKSDSEHSFSTSMWERKAAFPGSKEFLGAFVKRYEVEPSYHAATAYAAGQIFEAAVESVQSLECGRIRKALFELDYSDTVIGRYAVDRTGRQTKRFPIVIQWQGGTKQIVAPREIVTAKPQFVD